MNRDALKAMMSDLAPVLVAAIFVVGWLSTLAAMA